MIVLNSSLLISPSWTCEICGNEAKEYEIPISIGNLKQVCGECYLRGIAWAIRKAAEEARDVTQ